MTSTPGRAGPVLAALLVALVGCGEDAGTAPSAATSQQSTTTAAPATSVTPTATTAAPTAATTTVPAGTAATTTVPAGTAATTTVPAGTDALGRIWFVGGERLAPVYRVVVGPESAIMALLSGPDTGTDLATAIPEGTLLRSYRQEGSTAVIDLDATFASGGGTLSMQLRLGQLVATALEWPGTTAVRLLLDGQEVEALGGEGLLLDQPLDGADVVPVQALILVDEPRPGDVVTTPFTVRGSASVFENTVALEVRDADGRLLFEGFTTAEGSAFDDEGRPAWAPFTATITFDPGTATAGVVTAYESSAKDGTPINVMPVPIRFTPDGPFLTTLGPGLLPSLPVSG